MNESTLEFHNQKRELEMKVCALLNEFQTRTGLRFVSIEVSPSSQIGIDPAPVLGVTVEFKL